MKKPKKNFNKVHIWESLQDCIGYRLCKLLFQSDIAERGDDHTPPFRSKVELHLHSPKRIHGMVLN